ncbi:LuxR C-terminal-related transcriptional regulator [Streptomyces sp. NPDC002513]
MDNAQTPRSMFPTGELTDVDATIYAWVLRRRSLSSSEAADELGLSEQAAADSLKRLIVARLVYPSPDDPSAGFAVAPEAALHHLSAPIEADIRELQDQLTLVHQELDRFTAPFHQSKNPTSRTIEVIDNLHEVRAALAQTAKRCSTEMISCQPGGNARVPEAMREAMTRDHELLERGVKIRTLYHHTARFNAASQEYVATASALGAQYRTAHSLFGRLIVFDRETAFIPVQDASWGAVVIREPNTVAYLCGLFEQAWDLATPFADAASQGLEQVSRETHTTILRLLAAGLKDDTIARRLGMSLRTVRRHIADILEGLDATSRFQAGAAAARLGLLDGQEPAMERPTG